MSDVDRFRNLVLNFLSKYQMGPTWLFYNSFCLCLAGLHSELFAVSSGRIYVHDVWVMLRGIMGLNKNQQV